MRLATLFQNDSQIWTRWWYDIYWYYSEGFVYFLDDVWQLGWIIGIVSVLVPGGNSIVHISEKSSGIIMGMEVEEAVAGIIRPPAWCVLIQVFLYSFQYSPSSICCRLSPWCWWISWLYRCMRCFWYLLFYMSYVDFLSFVSYPIFICLSC